MPIPLSSTEKAAAYIINFIEQNKIAHGTKLPSIKVLAHKAELSKDSIAAGLKELQKKKVVVIRKNSGAYLGAYNKRTDLDKGQQHKQSRAQQIAQAITRDILEGKLDRSEILPSYKELAQQYRTGYQTIKEALAILVAEHRIVYEKKRHSILLHVPPASSNAIIAFHDKEFLNLYTQQSYLRSIFYVFNQRLEKECAERRLHLVRRSNETSFTNFEGFATALGFIVWFENPDDKKVIVLINNLVRYAKPIIVIDLFHTTTRCSDLIQSRHIHIFQTSEFNIGRTIGLYLLDAGHRKVCCMDIRKTPGTDNRYSGLISAYTAAGFSAESIVPMYAADFNSRTWDSSKPDPSVAKWRYDLLKDRNAIYSNSEYMDKLIADQTTRTQISHDANTLANSLTLRFNNVELFEAALASTKATVWMSDDYLLVFGALEYLKRKRIKIPADLSLIGVNNMIEAYYNDLTSYDFNFVAYVGQIIDLMLFPVKKTEEKNKAYLVEGFIASRGSIRILRT